MYGALPARMRLVVLPTSIFGAIGTPGHAFIGELITICVAVPLTRFPPLHFGLVCFK